MESERHPAMADDKAAKAKVLEKREAQQLRTNISKFKLGDPRSMIHKSAAEQETQKQSAAVAEIAEQSAAVQETQKQSAAVAEIAEMPFGKLLDTTSFPQLSTKKEESHPPSAWPQPRRIPLIAVEPPALKLDTLQPASVKLRTPTPDSDGEDADSTKTEETIGDTSRGGKAIYHSGGDSTLAERKIEPAAVNQLEEVGNFSLYACNLGARSLEAKDSEAKAAIRKMMDDQFSRSPGQLTMVTEANQNVEDIFGRPSTNGAKFPELKENGGRKLKDRGTFENHVVRIPEKESVLIAARKTMCESLECLHSEAREDSAYRKNRVDTKAITRILICKVVWHQKIGNLGKDLVVC